MSKIIIPVVSGITVGTTTITSGTSGAIPFNSAGVYQEDATQLFWDNTNNRLGVGTASPDAPMTLKNTNGSDLFTLHNAAGTQRFNQYISAGDAYLHYNTNGLEHRFSITNTMRFRIGSSYNELIGTLYLQGNSSSEALYISYPGAAGTRFGLYCNASQECVLSGLNTDILFYTGAGGATEGMRLTQSGNVSIGYGASPTARLHTKGSGATSATNTALFENSSGTDILVVRDDGIVNLGTGTIDANRALNIRGVGNTGTTGSIITTNTSNVNTHSLRDDGSAGFLSSVTAGSIGSPSDAQTVLLATGSSDGNRITSSIINTSGGSWWFNSRGNSAPFNPAGFDIYSNTTGVQHFTISSAGKVGIGDGVVAASTVQMQVTSTGSVVALQLTGRINKTQGADVASVAGAIALGYGGNTFEITGTNAITLISSLGWQNGSEVDLVFTSTAVLTDGTANSGTDIGMELAGGANFTGSADDIVTLKLCEVGGTQRWREKSRSVN
jgi:hypothetical protein